MQPVADAGGDAGGDAENEYWANPTPGPMESERQSDKLLNMKISLEQLTKHCRKQDLDTGLKMSNQGDIFIV